MSDISPTGNVCDLEGENAQLKSELGKARDLIFKSYGIDNEDFQVQRDFRLQLRKWLASVNVILGPYSG